MHEYTWRRSAATWLDATCSVEIESAGGPVGRLKIMGFGAVAVTPLGSFSFRPGGLDPMRRSFLSFWKRQVGHDATVLDLASNETVGSLSVSPLHNRFTLLGHSFYDWRLSFLGRKGRWKSNGEIVATIQAPLQGDSAGHAEVASVNSFESSMLLFFGVYLFVSGRAG